MTIVPYLPYVMLFILVHLSCIMSREKHLLQADYKARMALSDEDVCKNGLDCFALN